MVMNSPGETGPGTLLAALTTPVTTLPAGITTVFPTMTFSVTSPVHESPTCAFSLETCVCAVTLIGVPGATVTPRPSFDVSLAVLPELPDDAPPER